MTTEWLSFPDAPRIAVAPPGPRSRALLEDQRFLETDAVAYARHFPIAIREARGATIEDVDGNRFIDWVAGICVLNLGHRHPRIQAAIERQLAQVWHTLELPTEARIEFLRRLVAVLPGDLRGRARIFLTVTGGDAVETAVNLAEHATGRHGTVVFSGAYHGVHGGAAGLTSGRRYRATSAFLGARTIRVPYPDPFRPVVGEPGSAAGVLAYLEHLLSDPHSGFDLPAAVLVEPILGEGGYVVPPDDFLPGLRELCDRHGLLLIADEVQTGLGRTGTMWAVDHAGVTPDLLCTAKSLGGGLPLSAVAYRADLVPELPRGFHLGTYRGNALAVAAGTEVLRLLTDEDWIPRAARRGTETLHRLREITRSHPGIGDVRGRGFMIGIECVRDRSTNRPSPERAHALRAELLRRGVLMHTAGSHDQVLRFMAPLVIEDELLDRGLAAFAQALEASDDAAPMGRPAADVADPLARPTGPVAFPRTHLPEPFPRDPVPPSGPPLGRSADAARRSR